MARTHDRSTEDTDQAALIKRLKTNHAIAAAVVTAIDVTTGDPKPQFAPDVFEHTYIQKLNSAYQSSDPFKYAIIEKLFQDDLLKKVKDECLSELSFSEKETDIYKVNQTGDLASLSYLTTSQISLLPNLLTLRNALYSPIFRSFIRTVTGCGALSGTKQDMSVNSYTRGCHLLNHDDVIGSRRVSYILYMPLPDYQLWQKDWGGALELYPVQPNADGVLEPEPMPSKTVPPSWNQFIFFEVQPGRSFHSVEEVIVGGEGEDGRQRVSISGWFHAAQEGEEGYVPEPVSTDLSSREQLASTSTIFKPYPELAEPILPDTALSEKDFSFLSEFLNPVYLQPRTIKALASRFVEESSLELHSFLSEPLASKLDPGLRSIDARDGLGPLRSSRIPAHTAGTLPTDNGTGTPSSWQLKGPPHKWRYCTLTPTAAGARAEAVSPRAAQVSSNAIIRNLQEELYPSPAFRAWLAAVSNLLPLGYAVEARRFRPGLDYTLATSEEKEVRLDVVLGLTPSIVVDDDSDDSKTPSNGRRRASEEAERGWQTGEWGGWECYMAPHDEEDDPAVYRASSHKKAHTNGATPKVANGNGHAEPHLNGHAVQQNGNGHVAEPNGNSHVEKNDEESDAMDGDFEMDEDEAADEEQEEEDNTLLTVQPGFNRLLLVLRDERVMRFVKYVSAAAEGSRWDICGEYEIGAVQQEDDDEDDNNDERAS